MEQWTTYHRKGGAEARPYIPGEDLSAVSVSAADIPNTGGMIFRNPDNHADQWYVAEAWFKANYTGASRLAALEAFVEAVSGLRRHKIEYFDGEMTRTVLVSDGYWVHAADIDAATWDLDPNGKEE